MKRGFTLIELLVVITIIVVLLALLTPALDRAIYQAELAVCGANLKATGSGVTLYAMDARRRYPHRQAVMSGGDWEPHQLSDGGVKMDGQSGADDRPELLGYVSLALLVDPLTDDIRLDRDSNSPDTWCWAGYSLWYGWRYSGEAGMLRLGDRLAWEGGRFGVLAGDRDKIFESRDALENSHPDEDGVLELLTLRDEGFDEAADVDPALGTAVAVIANSTLSMWWGTGTHERGTVDTQYVATDGGVGRLDDVHWNSEEDDRIARVPYSTNPGGGPWPWPETYLNIPRR